MAWWSQKSAPGAPRAPQAHLHPLGEGIRCNDYEVCVASFGPHVVVSSTTVPEGHALWTALVEVSNLSDKPAHYADHNWRLYDVEHFSYEPIGLSGLVRQPRLGNSYLAPGARTKGYITFQLPEGAVPGRLSFVGNASRGVADFALPPEPELP